MIHFADEALIKVCSGKGGNGCIAFRREKYIPKGGPAGGDGGRGGDVVFCVRKNMRTLAHLRHKQVFRAKNGGDGEGHNRYGRDGEDVVIPLPPGTAVRDAQSGELICEFTTEAEDETFVFLTGGKGGWGNVHFKSPSNQAPRYAHEGKPGEERMLKIELSIMADIGLVGFPNAGKSSLLDFFTNARPKIAPYPFTTKIPNLGVLRCGDESDIIIADIPGIIEGASGGAGLGIRFLKHISRTAGLVFIIDCSDSAFDQAFEKLLCELRNFNRALSEKPRIVLCNKIDADGAAENAAYLAKLLPDETVIPMSLYSGEGLDNVRAEIISLAGRLEKSGGNGSSARKTKSAFMESRAVCSDENVQYPGSERLHPADLYYGARIRK
ncbi:MAG: GTPase ObgE [Bacteroides sp.]|nr:GTPase ObgE [Prevotella sp.]MCM1408354.1 GTPase ObgE [Treponema brennaborense]MCM1470415.1 GTPase ObgE [Bacteroides sp.]